MKLNKKLSVLSVSIVLAACSGTDDKDNNCSDTNSCDVEQVESASIIEGKKLFRFEHGGATASGLGYEVFWCDTWMFSNGVIYTNERSTANMTSCSEDVVNAGTYTISDNKILAMFTDVGTLITYDVLTNTSPFILRGEDSNNDKESNRLYDSKIAVEELLSTQEFSVNGDLISAEAKDLSTNAQYEPDDILDIDVFFEGMTCSEVNDKYEKFSLNGPALNEGVFINTQLVPVGSNTLNNYSHGTSVWEGAGSDSYCAIDYDFTTANYNESDFTSGDKYYFVAKAKHGLEDVKVLAIVP